MSGFSASKAQRQKVAGAECLVCGASPCDPMHVLPRSMGGDDDPRCVLPGCRRCHTLYDQGGLDLLRHLTKAHWTELAYVVSLAGLETVYRRVTNTRNPGGQAWP